VIFLPYQAGGTRLVVVKAASAVHHPSLIASRVTKFLAFVVLVIARNALAQGEVSGRVVAADSGRPPVQGAEASLPKLGRTAISDSVGKYSLKNVPSGEYLMVIRAIGFKSESSTVFIDRDEVVSSDVVLTRTTLTTLPERRVEAAEERPPAKLLEFMERKKTSGTGHFITREEIAKAEGGVRQTGDVISTIPGVRVRRGSNKVWIASGRAFGGMKCSFCSNSAAGLNPADFAAGARPACFMDVYLDGVLVYDSRHPENGLFDVNTVPPEHIEGIEVYASGGQVPAKYNRTANQCGVVLIWTR
jgi:carboxypeptidase-like protein/TonB-dependent receptor-like protein